MDIPWKSLSKSYVFSLSNTEHLRRNAQSCIRTSSPALRQWHGESLPRLFGNPALMVWPTHTYSVWPCWACQEHSCTVRSIIGLRHFFLTPQCPTTWHQVIMMTLPPTCTPTTCLLLFLHCRSQVPGRVPFASSSFVVIIVCHHSCPPPTPQCKESAIKIPSFASPQTTICYPLLFVVFGGGHRQQQGTHHSSLNKICRLWLLPLFSKHPSTLAACLALHLCHHHHW